MKAARCCKAKPRLPANDDNRVLSLPRAADQAAGLSTLLRTAAQTVAVIAELPAAPQSLFPKCQINCDRHDTPLHSQYKPPSTFGRAPPAISQAA